MIKLSFISKFFNKGKPNEIKALQNIDLELDEGLVMLVGKSGCGKTTLLNTIGGLEKPDCGSVTIGDTTISRYQCEQWDKLRNREIGYIFQNYNLIDELTVYQNLELVLKLAGIDPSTYEERILYALSLVGMEKFAKRHPSTLSGGQQQRVGIARAVVKGARIIIADEPTGNLDDTNTIAVMEVLKGLSKHCLVVVVTHEEDLAAFYADRIIRLKDGQIVEDYQNRSEGSLEHRAADRVYLGDMQCSDYNIDGLDISVFRESVMPTAKVTIVCQNGRILLKVDGENKVTYLNDSSTIRLEEGRYVPRQAGEGDIPIDMDILSGGNGKPRRIFTAKECFKNAFMRIYEKRGIRRRNPYRLLYLTAVFFVFLMALSAPAFLYDRDANVVMDDNVLAVVATYDQAGLPADLPKNTIVVNKVLSGIELEARFGSTYKDETVADCDSSCILPYSAIGGKVADGEVYIDKLLYQRMANANYLDGIARNAGELKGMYVYLSLYGNMYYSPLECYIEFDEEALTTWNMNNDGKYYKIAGIVDRNMPVVYFSDTDYAALPTAHFYRQNSGTKETITLLFNKDKRALRSALEAKNQQIYDVNAAGRKMFYRNTLLSKLVYIILACIVLLIQVFGLYRSAKNDYLGKIKLYAQYRSIGVSRGAIYGKISMESAVTSVLTSLRGWLFATVILAIVANMQIIKTLSLMGITFVYYPVWFALVCGAFLVVLGQVVNLLAPLVMLTHTPAHLMSKYDM